MRMISALRILAILLPAGLVAAEGGHWRFEVVETDVSFDASNCGLALDSLGRPHLAFYDDTPSEEVYVQYAVRTSEGWSIERVDVASGDQAVIRLDADDAPHVLYNEIRSVQRVRYAKLEPTGWRLEDIHPPEIRGREPLMVLDSAGVPHVAFIDNGGIDFKTYYGTKRDGEWILESMGSGSLTSSFGPGSIVLDAAGEPLILGVLDGFTVAMREEGEWGIHARLGPPELYSPNTDATTGSDGQIHVSGISTSDGDLVYVAGQGLVWSATIVDPTGPQGLSNTSIALDSDGNPRIAYRTHEDESDVWPLKHAVFDGQEWTTEVVSDDLLYPSGAALTVDARGSSHLAYWRQGPSGGELLYAVQDVTDVTPFRRGDANADGLWNIADAVLVLHHLLVGDRSPPCLKAADSDESGDITLSDAVFVLHYLFLGTPAPQEPFSECGFDPTPDDLPCLRYPPCGSP